MYTTGEPRIIRTSEGDGETLGGEQLGKMTKVCFCGIHNWPCFSTSGCSNSFISKDRFDENEDLKKPFLVDF